MENFDDLIKIKTNNTRPARGRILISEPFLYDYYFHRSVILLAEHNKEGSFGVIINKPLALGFGEVVKDFPDFNATVYLGVPVSADSLFFIHTLGVEIDGSMEIMEGLYWGGDLEQIKSYITIGRFNNDNIRFFIGYSGWSPNQLDSELQRNSWAVSALDADQIMKADPAGIWKSSLIDLGAEYSKWTNYPSDPGLN